MKGMTVEIEGVTLHLAHPDELAVQWVGQDELMRQLLAAWMVVNEQDLPMNPRLLGKPGVGKTTLAYAAGRRMGRDVYILQATLDTRPEDLLVTPVIEGEGSLRYVASPLVTAMIRGGIAILDEGNRMSEKSWASLAPLLDNRRYVESIVAGIKIKAHPQFRMVATMNDDASTFELPEYIHSRLQPQIFIDFPERDEEYHILKENLPFAEERILSYVTDFLQMAHAADERYTVRDGINVARYAIKLKSLATERTHETEALEVALVQVLGEERYGMPGELDLPLPDLGSLKRGRFTYFPVVPGRLEFAIEVRQAILRDRPGVIALELPVTSAAMPGSAPCARLPEMSLIFYPDEATGEDQAIYVPIEPADPFTEAIRTGLEIGAEIVFADPDAGQRPHLQGRLPGFVRHPAHRPGPLHRGLPRVPAGARRGNGAARCRDRLEAAGHQSRCRRPGGGVVEPARPGAGRHGGAPGAAHGGHPARRRRTASIRTPNPWPKSPPNIPSSSGATKTSAS